MKALKSVVGKLGIKISLLNEKEVRKTGLRPAKYYILFHSVYCHRPPVISRSLIEASLEELIRLRPGPRDGCSINLIPRITNSLFYFVIYEIYRQFFERLFTRLDLYNDHLMKYLSLQSPLNIKKFEI